MRIKKHKGKVFGANLTAAERQAMKLEINRQILEQDEKYTMAHYGWKKKRLKKFWKAFVAEHKALREFYQMNGSGDNEWLAHRELKEIGVDIHQWYKEGESNED